MQLEKFLLNCIYCTNVGGVFVFPGPLPFDDDDDDDDDEDDELFLWYG